jgi:glutathione reductase (NADPH)
MIVGAGYIGLEFAGIFAGLGAHVTLVHRGDEVLRGFDDDVRHHVRVEMEGRGIRIVLKHEVASIGKKGRALIAELTDGAMVETDQVMFATGRRPNTGGIGLEKVGVRLDKSGAIAVDASSRTSVPSIFAIGDVTDRLQLTPVAIREGHAFADSEFGNNPWTVDHKNVPTAVFSEPEIGVVGQTEAEARESGREVEIYRTSFRPMKSTMSGRATTVLMKLVVERASDRVLGVHIVGEGAAEMIQMVAIAVKMGARKADLDATVALHPSAAEELVTLRNPV